MNTYLSRFSPYFKFDLKKMLYAAQLLISILLLSQKKLIVHVCCIGCIWDNTVTSGNCPHFPGSAVHEFVEVA